jgi:thiol-disulfide isomerase/thioredoxin
MTSMRATVSEMRHMRLPALLPALLLAACASAPMATSPAPQATSAQDEASGSPSAQASPEPTASGGATVADPLLAYELSDVRSGATFTLAELADEKPVLLETMAIWCTNCLAQQREVVRAHDLGDFHSVGVDVDPNERAPELATYADREGFDWRFAIADRELVQLLTERFGFQVSNPPSTPTFVVSGGEIRALEFGRHRSAEELIEELGSG